MKLEHLAMYVNDLEKTKTFFETYFEAKSNEMYHNPNTGLRTYFLSFGEGGARLEIMNKPNQYVRDKTDLGEGYIHIAFSVGAKDKVDSLTARLKQDGYEVTSGPRTTGDGYYESCIVGIEGNLIEVTE